jgi:hypothetical protein
VWETGLAKSKQGQIGKAGKMLKKVTTDIKAAVMLIATEDLTALRMFAKNVTNSVFKSPANKMQSGGRKRSHNPERDVKC